jgi:hypothetical protein
MQRYAFQEKRSALLKLSQELGREEYSLAILGEGNVSAPTSEDSFIVRPVRGDTGNTYIYANLPRMLC